jgi:hypothetical protein
MGDFATALIDLQPLAVQESGMTARQIAQAQALVAQWGPK